MVAHQAFALRLLNWIQGFLDFSSGFRALFSDVILFGEPPRNISIAESLCRRDSRLWKAARTQVHHMLISGWCTYSRSDFALDIS